MDDNEETFIGNLIADFTVVGTLAGMRNVRNRSPLEFGIDFHGRARKYQQCGASQSVLFDRFYIGKYQSSFSLFFTGINMYVPANAEFFMMWLPVDPENLSGDGTDFQVHAEGSRTFEQISEIYYFIR